MVRCWCGVFSEIVGQVGRSWSPVYIKLFLLDSVLNPIKSHLHLLEYVLDNKARPALRIDQTSLGTPELNNSGTCKSSLRTGPSYLKGTKNAEHVSGQKPVKETATPDDLIKTESVLTRYNAKM
jgi:hypothetical protein